MITMHVVEAWAMAASWVEGSVMGERWDISEREEEPSGEQEQM